MNVDNGAPLPTRPLPDDEEVRVLQVAEIVVRRAGTIVLTMGVAVVLAVLIYLLQPERYSARVVLVPSVSESSGRSQLLAAQLPTGLGELLGRSDSQEQLISAILESRSLADSLVARLAGADETEQDLIRQIVTDETRVQRESDGSIVIVVRDSEPARAARIANEFPDAINSNVVRISSEAAVRKQEFLERQIAVAAQRLEVSEQALVEFQQTQDLPEVQEQARRTVEVAAELQQAIFAQELKVAQLVRMATPDHPELRAARAELADLQGQLRRLSAGLGTTGQILVPLQASPELKVASIRLLREFTKNEQVYTALTASLAETQIDANNNLPVVSVLDLAEEPRAPSGLALPLLAGMALALGMVLGLVLAFGREFMSRARQDPESQSFFNAWDDSWGRATRWLPRRRAAVAKQPVR
jgi:uncharacterized protein involved in exopolysaccharide biosynthesis